MKKKGKYRGRWIITQTEKGKYRERKFITEKHRQRERENRKEKKEEER
jgi:hypothetical protein